MAGIRQVRMGRGAPGGGPDVTVVRRGTLRLAAKVDPGASPHGTHTATLRWLVDLLESADVEYWVLPRDESFVDVGVPEESRTEILGLLRSASLQGSPVTVILGKPGRPAVGADEVWRQGRRRTDVSTSAAPRRVLGSPQCPTKWLSADAFGIVVPRVDPEGRRVIAEEAEVRIGFWRRVKGGRQAPEPNPWASHLSESTLAQTRVVDVLGVRARGLADLGFRHAEHVDFPVDVVYTWVDGGDPAWRARMRSRNGTPEVGAIGGGLAADRFHSIDELRYSLRSLHQHAPWVRHIWLVTDGQRPEWLEHDDPRVSVVDHREIWSDPSVLPVFNSHAIESQLHHIPGLAEHYVYLNDDVVLTSMLRPTAFFSPGGVLRMYPSPVHVGVGEWMPDESAVAAADRNDRELLLATTASGQTLRLRHTGHAQRRSVALELEGLFGLDYARTAASAFRSRTDISPIALHCWYALRTGRAVIGVDVRLAYVDLAAPDAARRIGHLDLDGVDFLCLNRTEQSVGAVEVERAAMQMLDAAFPFRAPWEGPVDER